MLHEKKNNKKTKKQKTSSLRFGMASVYRTSISKAQLTQRKYNIQKRSLQATTNPDYSRPPVSQILVITFFAIKSRETGGPRQRDAALIFTFGPNYTSLTGKTSTRSKTPCCPLMRGPCCTRCREAAVCGSSKIGHIVTCPGNK